jgi:opacity protein-like surface antigen
MMIGLAAMVSAQDSARAYPNYFGFSAGAAFPFGHFLKKDFRDPKSGFANTGSNLQLEYHRNLALRFGALARLNISSNPYDVYELARSYKNADTSGDVTYSVNSRNWYCIGGMLGLRYRIPFKDFGVELKALAGYQYAESPDVRQTISNGTDSVTLHITPGNAAALVWTAGGGIYYRFTRVWIATASVEYLAFNGTFKGSKMFIDEVPLANRNDFNTDILLLNCNLGLRYRF